eukprot:scaffold276800_cov28-Tisochrysis_lutea.AAC.2
MRRRRRRKRPAGVDLDEAGGRDRDATCVHGRRGRQLQRARAEEKRGAEREHCAASRREQRREPVVLRRAP